MAQLAPQIYTHQIIDAYDAFDGEDIGEFTEAWDHYIAGKDVPCITPDGLHQITAGSCDQCGRKNYA